MLWAQCCGMVKVKEPEQVKRLSYNKLVKYKEKFPETRPTLVDRFASCYIYVQFLCQFKVKEA